MSDNPTTGEWTVRQWVDANGEPRNSWDIRDSQGEVVCADLTQEEAHMIINAHNAALAAAWRKGHADAQSPALERIEELQQQLAAERELAWRRATTLERQITDERERLGDIAAEQRGLKEKAIEQLAAEREKVQTLRDALTEIANSNEDSQYLSRVAEDALAKVEDQPVQLPMINEDPVITLK